LGVKLLADDFGYISPKSQFHAAVQDNSSNIPSEIIPSDTTLAPLATNTSLETGQEVTAIAAMSNHNAYGRTGFIVWKRTEMGEKGVMLEQVNYRISDIRRLA